MAKTTDPDFHVFASGATRIPPSPRSSLKSELIKFGDLPNQRRYKRTKKQKDDAKRVSDRIMGERDDNPNA